MGMKSFNHDLAFISTSPESLVILKESMRFIGNILS
jgi:hypothetical protein